MDMHEAMRTGLPIAIGGAIGRHPDDREDMIEEAVLPGLADADVVNLDAELGLSPEEVPQPHQEGPLALEADVEAILARIDSIEARMRQRLGLHRVHAALDRLDALLT